MPLVELHPPRSWPTLGRSMVSWIETHACHGPGDVQGQPLWFCDEMAQFILDAYRLFPVGHPWAGRRVIEYALLSEPKGFAKSEGAAGIGFGEFLGPCRFDHWAKRGEVSPWGYRYRAGEPVGRPMQYPFIRLLATEEGQTGNTYKALYAMLEYAGEKFGNCDAGRFGDVDLGSTRALLGKGGIDGGVYPCSAGAASKDGGLETWACADEPHLYVLPEHRAMHEIVRNNSVKRQAAEPWMLGTTTMFQPGQGSVAEDLYREAQALVAIPDTERTSHEFLYLHREGFEVPEGASDEELIPAVEEAYAPVLDHMDVHRIIRRMRAPGSTWANGVRFYLNRQHKGEGKAVDLAKWDRLADPTRTIEPGSRVLLCFDGSGSDETGTTSEDGDHTVLGAWLVDPRPHYVELGWWRPERIGGEWKIDRAAVRAVVTWARTTYDVVRFVADPHKWGSQLEAWDVEFGVDHVGDPIVLSFDTSKGSRMGPAIDRFREDLDEAKFTHAGDAHVRWYVGNALLGPMKGYPQFHALTKPTKAEKIDGLIVPVIGYDQLAHEDVDGGPAPFLFTIGGGSS